MFHIRTTKTASGGTAVQVVRYQRRKLIVAKHVGTAHDEEGIKALSEEASVWIERETRQSSLFSNTEAPLSFQVKRLRYMGFHYAMVYESLYELCRLFRFNRLRNKLLVDLVIVRIAEPSSKLESIEFLREFMGIEHRRQDFYDQVSRFLSLKNTVKSKALEIAKKEFGFNFSLVFYDVTTLYFESFESDELRQCGFSKDNKFNQPQIVLGLLVSANGFPVAYQIFNGKKFEGHTLIPVILRFRKRYKIESFTVVGDAAMISSKNITALRSAHLEYIVGARTANLPMDSIKEISARLRQHDGTTMRMETEYGDLVCEFSDKRFAKDNREMEKQIAKAEELLKNPGKIRKAKFITSQKQGYTLNMSLIEKTKLLLGIKGYYTNLPKSEADDKLIIEQYHNLWHVEQAFRIAKSDLQMRPMYHFKQKTIEAHALICFMALAICKYMELKTDKSVKSILKLLKGVTDATVVDTVTGEKFVLRSPVSEEVKQLLRKMLPATQL